MIALFIILGLVAVVGIWAVTLYNGLIRQRNVVKESWRQIDVELKRRHDLIPNLVETVKGYASHERGTLDEVIRARGAAMHGGGSPAQTAAAEGQLSQALGRLIAVSEAYPELKANQNFQQLQSELTSTEDRIASARRYYNANVRDLNTKVEAFPTNLIANNFGIKGAEYFEIAEGQRETVGVDFGQGNPQVSFPQSTPQQPAAVTDTPQAPAPQVTPAQAPPASQPAQPVQQPAAAPQPPAQPGEFMSRPEGSTLDLPEKRPGQ